MSARGRLTSILALTLFLGLASAGTARADIIGSFSWDDCGVFSPCFTVGNFSADVAAFPIDFTDASVAVSTGTDVFVEDLGTVAPESSAQTIGDYSSLAVSLVSLSISSDTAGILTLLSFDENGNLVPIEGLTAPGESASIDFQPRPQAVPEPGTLILLAAGIGAIGLESRRRRQAVRVGRAED